jgi:SH3 domain-containing protein
MSRLELSPPTVLSRTVARLSQGVANSNAKPNADSNAYLSTATQSSLPLTLERLELIKAYAKDPVRNADGQAVSRIAQRFAPRPPSLPSSDETQSALQAPLTAPVSALTSGIRRLTAVLVVAALLPNLTLAAFWLRVIDPPWSERVAAPPPKVAASATQDPAPAIEPELATPVLSTPSALEGPAGKHMNFPIALDGTDAVPPSSVIVIKGLPQGSRLSTGSRRGATEWTLRPDEIGDLHLVLPPFAVGESKLTIQLVAPGDHIVADATTMLRLIADQAPTEVGAREAEIEPVPQVPDAPAAELVAASEEATGAIAAAAASDEVVPLPIRRPEPPKSDDTDASWIKSSAHVNLRKAPSSSASVVSVVAKGTKLRVVSRKRGWVQVTNPATSESGWIYSGNVATAP